MINHCVHTHKRNTIINLILLIFKSSSKIKASRTSEGEERATSSQEFNYYDLGWRVLLIRQHLGGTCVKLRRLHSWNTLYISAFLLSKRNYDSRVYFLNARISHVDITYVCNIYKISICSQHKGNFVDAHFVLWG